MTWEISVTDIKKVDELTLVCDAGIAHQDAAQVGAQIAIAAQTIGEGVGDQCHSEYQNGLAVLIGKGQAREQQDGDLADDYAAQNTDGDL